MKKKSLLCNSIYSILLLSTYAVDCLFFTFTVLFIFIVLNDLLYVSDDESRLQSDANC